MRSFSVLFILNEENSKQYLSKTSLINLIDEVESIIIECFEEKIVQKYYNSGYSNLKAKCILDQTFYYDSPYVDFDLDIIPEDCICYMNVLDVDKNGKLSFREEYSISVEFGREIAKS